MLLDYIRTFLVSFLAGTVKGEKTSVDDVVGYILKKNSYDRPESLEMNFQTMLLILKWETTYQLFFSG
jgi:hypothetical protein